MRVRSSPTRSEAVRPIRATLYRQIWQLLPFSAGLVLDSPQPREAPRRSLDAPAHFLLRRPLFVLCPRPCPSTFSSSLDLPSRPVVVVRCRSASCALRGGYTLNLPIPHARLSFGFHLCSSPDCHRASHVISQRLLIPVREIGTTAPEPNTFVAMGAGVALSIIKNVHAHARPLDRHDASQ